MVTLIIKWKLREQMLHEGELQKPHKRSCTLGYKHSVTDCDVLDSSSEPAQLQLFGHPIHRICKKAATAMAESTHSRDDEHEAELLLEGVDVVDDLEGEGERCLFSRGGSCWPSSLCWCS